MMQSLSLILARRTFHSRRAAIYAKMAFGLERGGTPANEFRAMYRNAVKRKSRLVPIYRYWDESLRGHAAGRMSRAMYGTIPDAEYGLLAIAEENRSLVKGLQFLSHSVQRVSEMLAGFVDAIRSTALPLLMLIGMIICTDLFFFPQLEDTLPRREWPIMTKLVAGAAHETGTVLTYGMFVLPALFVLYIWSLPRLTGRLRRFLERMPLLYSKYRDYQCVLFQVNLAFLREAEVSPRMSLVKIEKISTPYMKQHVQTMLQNLNKDATNFGEVIVSTGLFSPDLAELISDYARWSDWHSQMRAIADSSLKIVTDDVKRLGPLMHDLLQLTIGAVIFIITAASASAVVKVMMQVSR